MSKLIVCCDGTWNDSAAQTHIWRIWRLAWGLPDIDSDHVYYDEGVGARDRSPAPMKPPPGGWTTFSWLAEKVGGGAFGLGISVNILEAYRWIAERWQDGDELYLFGFSRGAFTVRSLVGLIGYAGLLRPDDLDAIDDAWNAYRTRDHANRRAHPWLQTLQSQQARKSVPIRFLGVFDTVGALGLPIGWLQRLDVWLHPERDATFHDTQLSSHVRHAAHALSIDERRGPFKPTLWEGEAAADQTIRQCWFAGVHSDVGGGYDDKRLAELALEWLLDEAAEAGLDMRQSCRKDPTFRPDAEGPAHNSVTLPYMLAHVLPSMRYFQRPIGQVQRGGTPPRPVPGETVHWSVAKRFGADAVPIHKSTGPYRPASLTQSADNRARLVLPDEVALHDRRQGERRRADVDAQIRGCGTCRIVDAGRGGARLAVDNPLPVGTRIRLEPARAGMRARDAVVCWNDRRRRQCGVRFEATSETQAA